MIWDSLEEINGQAKIVWERCNNRKSTNNHNNQIKYSQWKKIKRNTIII